MNEKTVGIGLGILFLLLAVNTVSGWFFGYPVLYCNLDFFTPPWVVHIVRQLLFIVVIATVVIGIAKKNIGYIAKNMALLFMAYLIPMWLVSIMGMIGTCG